MIWSWQTVMCMLCSTIHPVLQITVIFWCKALENAKQEKTTPWLGADTAKHYQWYPFINTGHYELIKPAAVEKKWSPGRLHKTVFAKFLEQCRYGFIVLQRGYSKSMG